MDRWIGRVALVTGASSGIGAGICEALVKNGMKVVGAARRLERMQELSAKLQGSKGVLIPFKCDVSQDTEVESLFQFIKEKYGGVDICVNNAGKMGANSLLDGNPEEWRGVLDVNIIALCLCTKLAVKSMRERGVDDGHIINISSIAGHKVSNIAMMMHMYSAGKFAMSAITEGVRQELKQLNSGIRVATLSPGTVQTDMIDFVNTADPKAAEIFSKVIMMQPEDMAEIVLLIMSLPARVEINDVLVTPTKYRVV